MPQTRRSHGKVPTNATGLLYLLCFRERLGTDKHSIKHYLGYAEDLDARLERHRAGRGARVTQVLRERGIEWDLVAVWPGNRTIENQLKLHSATRICPECTPGAEPPRQVQAVMKAEEKRRAREARKAARQVEAAQRRAAVVAEQAAKSPYERGADMAQRWIRGQVEAGRTAEQIAATNAYITGPLQELSHANGAKAETFHGWSEAVQVELARVRESEPTQQAAGPGPAEAQATERSAPADQPEREEPMPENGKGPWLTDELIDRIQKLDAGEPPAAEASAEAEYEPTTGGGLDDGRFADYGDGPAPSWEKTAAEVNDWEAEAWQTPELEADFEPPY